MSPRVWPQDLSQLHFAAGQIEAASSAVGDIDHPGLVGSGKVRPIVARDDDRGALLLEPGSAAGVIAVVVGEDDVLDRFVGDALHLGHEIVVLALALRIDEDDATGGHVDCGVAAPHAELGDGVVGVLHNVDRVGHLDQPRRLRDRCAGCWRAPPPRAPPPAPPPRGAAGGMATLTVQGGTAGIDAGCCAETVVGTAATNTNAPTPTRSVDRMKLPPVLGAGSRVTNMATLLAQNVYMIPAPVGKWSATCHDSLRPPARGAIP